MEEKLSLLEILKSNRNILLILSKDKKEKKRRKEEEKEWPDVVLNKYMKQRNEIKGFIVEFSQNFLKDEKFNKNKIFPEYAYA